jgi:UDP-N-acetylglucosamine 2-epimerase (non-hydrolysing)
MGVDGEGIRSAWQQIRQGDWPRGRLPELWDGKAADRIVRILQG